MLFRVREWYSFVQYCVIIIAELIIAGWKDTLPHISLFLYHPPSLSGSPSHWHSVGHDSHHHLWEVAEASLGFGADPQERLWGGRSEAYGWSGQQEAEINDAQNHKASESTSLSTFLILPSSSTFWEFTILWFNYKIEKLGIGLNDKLKLHNFIAIGSYQKSYCVKI